MLNALVESSIHSRDLRISGHEPRMMIQNIQATIITNHNRWAIIVYAVEYCQGKSVSPIVNDIGATDLLGIPLTLTRTLVVQNAIYKVNRRYKQRDGYNDIAVLEISGAEFNIISHEIADTMMSGPLIKNRS